MLNKYLEIDLLYNVYKYKGLLIGFIGNLGIEFIKVVLLLVKINYIYYIL